VKADTQVITQPRILLVEDNPGDARLMRYYLHEGAGDAFALELVSDLESALARLRTPGISLILLDLTLPDSMGLDTFAQMHTAAPEIPIIVLSGRDDEALAIKTVHEGAQDYLVKGMVDSRLLVRAIRYAMERKRAEEALAYERDLFHTLLDNLPDRIYFKDHKSRFIRISKAVVEQFKIDHPKKAIRKTDFDFFAPEHAEAAMRDEQEVMKTGTPILGKVEKEVLPDGSVTWALTSKMPLRDKQGRVIGNFGISRDITALKDIEGQLAAERNLLRSLIDNLPDYIYVKDSLGQYVIDNLAHQRLLGVDRPEDIIGKTAYDFFSAELADAHSRDDQQVFETGHPVLNREEPFVDLLGNRRWHATTKVPLRNNDGLLVGLVAIARDITERKLSEEQLQKAHQELARSKGELEKVFADLQKSHEELKAAQFQLIEAEKMQSVGRLAAGVAHEVKNPLAILGMGIDYMAKNLHAADPNISGILTDMNDAVKRADTIIHGLLDFSMPHALNLHAEDLNQLLEQSLGMVRHDLSSSGQIRIVRELAEDVPAVCLDRNKIKQVFVNLLLNAIHAMPEGGTLTIRTYARTLQAGEIDRDAGSRVPGQLRTGETVVVTEFLDTGTGIDMEKMAKIFDPFFTTKPTGKGTGLGLTVTKKIVELHHGTIDIRNRPEGGAHVTLRFKI
jgi:PAS domain S-box-containing protein